MSNYIFGFDNWKKFYLQNKQENKKKTWVFVKTSDEKEIYLTDYNQWLTIQEYVDKKSLKILSVGLRHKTNQILVDTSTSDAVYLVRSVKGEFGSVTRQCFTIGKINGDEVEKTMWLTPELIEESFYIDHIDECFPEAIVYNDKQKRKAQPI
jgi:hypothetical protein